MNIISQGFPKNKLGIVVSEKTEIARKKINKLILKLLFSCGNNTNYSDQTRKKPFTLLLMAWLHFSPIGKAHQSQVSFTNYKKQN